MTPTPTAPLRELLAKATQVERAPFDTYSFIERRRTGDERGYRDVTVWALRGESGRHVAYSDFEEVARACVALLNAMPACLDELEHLRAERERTEAALRQLCAAMEKQIHTNNPRMHVSSLGHRMDELGLWRDPQPQPQATEGKQP